jgi:hypothetical protein
MIPISEIIDKIYAAEINIRISWTWDGGFWWFVINPLIPNRHNTDIFALQEKIFDEDFACIIEEDWIACGSKDHFTEMVIDLADNITKIFPDSTFTEWYIGQNEKKAIVS